MTRCLGVPKPISSEDVPIDEVSEVDPVGDEWSGRDEVFAAHGCDEILWATKFMNMIRTRDWKLVHFFDEYFG